MFVSACNADSDNDGLTDFDEGEFNDSDGDGVLDYLESNIIDSDADGVFDYLESNILDNDGDGFVNQFDVWNDDACRPDASQCTYEIPLLSVFGQSLLGVFLFYLARRGFGFFEFFLSSSSRDCRATPDGLDCVYDKDKEAPHTHKTSRLVSH